MESEICYYCLRPVGVGECVCTECFYERLEMQIEQEESYLTWVVDKLKTFTDRSNNALPSVPPSSR